MLSLASRPEAELVLSFLLLVQHSERVCGLSLALAGCFKMAFLNTFMTRGIPGWT